MSGRRSLVWLGLTPEPERELPAAVAALRPRPADLSLAALTTAERRRVERLILRGTQRSWLGYLAEVTALVVDAAEEDTSIGRSPSGDGNRSGDGTPPADGNRSGGGTAPADPHAALVAGEVVLDHHRMLIGLPGAGYDRAAPQRQALEQALLRLRNRADKGVAA